MVILQCTVSLFTAVGEKSVVLRLQSAIILKGFLLLNLSVMRFVKREMIQIRYVSCGYCCYGERSSVGYL